MAVGLVVTLTACGGGSTDTPGGRDISSGSHHVNLIAYATPKPGFDKIIPAFRDTDAGSDIGFSQSYGASGDQSRKVARRVPADVVNFSVEPDITRLVKAGVVDEDWKTQHPNNSTPFGSVVALVVRQGNPKNIRDWDDLLKPGVEVITPNPGSSGSAKWNLLAPFAAKSNGGVDEKAGLAYVSDLVRDHIRVNPKSGREATTTFEQGQGDVLISYENEAIMLQRKNGTAPASQRVDYVIPPQTFKIENPVAVVNTSDDKASAEKFVEFLFTDEGQRIWAQQGFRPVTPSVIAATRSLFPGTIDKLWTISALGKVLGKGTAAENSDTGKAGKDLTGWKAVDSELFGTKGAISKIYDAGGKA
ncbi:sulfate ABC transporter substrate-binding protein [Williamsia sp. Leaf354]|uniref:sulfate ABC transporter substrate-binding protein n=1 Tax=Williamsia sp. Leaf354 TaxID=1736349 RepID=UPI0006FB1D8A|nr:sulfate ABC transporter substrate-binding protein [Williamsia sp. Leaf354]KQR98233.1 sulfate ABC transporter substrate-binding protein [Williamsia sp. Leaf354]